MKIKVVDWVWEDPEAQASFVEWVGFPDLLESRGEVDCLEQLLGLHPPRRILDVGCGAGRHAIELARRGYEVVGIDVAQGYLERARLEGQRQGMAVEFRLQRGSELTELETFDLALAYNHTLGFMTEEELGEHFRRIARALKPEGCFLLVIAGPRLTPGMSQERIRNWTERNGKYILTEKWIGDGYRTERSIVIDPVQDEMIEYRERQRAFSLEEVRARLERAGFRAVACLQDFTGRSATPESFGIFIGYKGNSDKIFPPAL